MVGNYNVIDMVFDVLLLLLLLCDVFKLDYSLYVT